MRDTSFISKDTKLFVSLAEMPGNLGTRWFNWVFGQYEIDAIYKAFQVKRNDFERVFDGLRALGVAGGAISMPFKKLAANLVDRTEGVASELGVINTFRREKNGELVGFNTDYIAACKALPEKMTSVYLLGTGGVAASVAWAISKKQTESLTLISRSPERNHVSESIDFKWEFWDLMSQLSPPEVVINCTPLGMTSKAELEIPHHWWDEIKLAVDLTYRPEGNLFSQQAIEKDIPIVDGRLFSRWQAIEQFKIYTGIELNNWEESWEPK